jgi:hypothetical protein
MCFKILTVKGMEISRTSVLPLSLEDKNSKPVQQHINKVDQALQNALGDRAAGLLANAINDDMPEFETYEDDTMTEPIVTPETDEYDLDTYHKLISARALLPRGNGKSPARVIKRKLDEGRKLIGTAHVNPLLDTRQYKVLFDDGDLEYYSANTIAENIFQQVDGEGNLYSIIDEITDHKKSNDAVHPDDDFVSMNGKQYPKRTTWD